MSYLSLCIVQWYHGAGGSPLQEQCMKQLIAELGVLFLSDRQVWRKIETDQLRLPAFVHHTCWGWQNDVDPIHCSAPWPTADLFDNIRSEVSGRIFHIT